MTFLSVFWIVFLPRRSTPNLIEEDEFEHPEDLTQSTDSGPLLPPILPPTQILNVTNHSNQPPPIPAGISSYPYNQYYPNVNPRVLPEDIYAPNMNDPRRKDSNMSNNMTPREDIYGSNMNDPRRKESNMSNRMPQDIYGANRKDSNMSDRMTPQDIYGTNGRVPNNSNVPTDPEDIINMMNDWEKELGNLMPPVSRQNSQLQEDPFLTPSKKVPPVPPPKPATLKRLSMSSDRGGRIVSPSPRAASIIGEYADDGPDGSEVWFQSVFLSRFEYFTCNFFFSEMLSVFISIQIY